jgi:hypothetical protein
MRLTHAEEIDLLMSEAAYKQPLGIRQTEGMFSENGVCSTAFVHLLDELRLSPAFVLPLSVKGLLKITQGDVKTIFLPSVQRQSGERVERDEVCQ